MGLMRRLWPGRGVIRLGGRVSCHPAGPPSCLSPQVGVELKQTGCDVSTVEADRLRDTRQYQLAAQAYAALPERAPQRADLRVQHANMLKESGRLDEAASAYRAVLTQTPHDADIYLQLGHALKLQNQRDAAIDAYRQAAELDPGKPESL